MAHADGSRSGGRKAGTPNKATRELKNFLERVFARAFSERRTRRTVDAAGGVSEVEYSLEDRLVDGIIEGTIDSKELTTLLAYWAGRPSQAVDHTVKGKLSLEQLITGNLPKDATEDEDA